MSNSTISSDPIQDLQHHEGPELKNTDTQVMWIVGHKVHLKSEFYLYGMNFNCVDIEHGEQALADSAPEAILVLFRPDIHLNDALRKIKGIAEQRSLPIVLYSLDFDSQARVIASEYKFDDYYYGTLKEHFAKKLQMIKKAKEYKNLKNNYKGPANLPPEEDKNAPMLKRTFDIVVASTVLIILSPLLLLTALIIKLESRGPVFYISKRAGKNYKVFDFIKFRSMYPDADARLDKLSAQNQYSGGVFIKIKDDPRVTPFGKILRKTSLDEIPQLINVIRGDMSIVGNRPLPLYEAELLTKDRTARRFLAPAGVTGLWQVTKRGKDDMSDEERINLDIEYARKHTLWYDIRLLVNTIPAMLQKEAV